jgi:ResB-like family
MHVIEAVYGFLASLKLAVFTISALAASLAFATWLESTYGTATSQDFVYKAPWFAVLLAFLATNILCAALIRFPWKKRQTGFVITHAGLLILIAGSYLGFRTSDEGMMAMLEGESRAQVQRRQDSVILVREVDPHTQKPDSEFELHFKPGPFAWGGGEAHLRNLLDLALSSLSSGGLPAPARSGETLSQPDNPFKLVVKKYLPAAMPAVHYEDDPDGDPAAKFRLEFKGPGMAQGSDAFPPQWFKLERRFYRRVRSDTPALLAFSYVDRPELVEDFLKPPLNSSPQGVARFRYPDKSGHTVVHDLPMEGQEGKTISLPGSDLKVTVDKFGSLSTQEAGLSRILGQDDIALGFFDVRKGDGPPIKHIAMGSMPMVPNIIPNPNDPQAKPQQPLASIHLMILPNLDPRTTSRMGQIEVLAGPDRALYYRVFGRGKEGKTEIRSAGPLELGKTVNAFGGGTGMPMAISFRVEDYLPSAVEEHVFEPVFLPKGKMDEGIPACELELTVGDVTRDFWLQRSESSDSPSFTPVAFGDRLFEVAYDTDRRPLDFQIKLDKFDIGFERGTEQPTKFASHVRLTDQSQGIHDQPLTTSMNQPFTHRGFTFYQSRYAAIPDPHTGEPTGQFQSVLQVGTDPARPIKYAGCMVIVLGIFVQFYMRAGVFSDGGKRERERAALVQRESGYAAPVQAAPAPEERL